ncbi:hypothetical protein [Thioalbus denitrificans]|uniref:hypothetical protein n=1 Tax=Thioalbus denitrificans TaxID=547122 RepID=UPI0011C0227A|nr:hypothetical protein [Thioalbus denitrificans]
MSTFQDIKIVGMDDAASHRPDPNKALYDIVLILSSSTPYEWADYFNARWKQQFYMMKRNASVSGKSLTICCVPEELEKHHLPELKKVIEETNQKYKEYLQAQQVQEQQRAEQEKAEKEMLSNMKGSIKLD